jgi:threonine/homoserine efflux transporter RhtA
MDGPGSIGATGLVLMLLLRPWQLRDDASREYSALVAAVLLGIVLVQLCLLD